MFGAFAWFLSMALFVVARLFRNVPKRPYKITEDTLQSLIRSWLDEVGVKVQTLHEPKAHFMFVVTCDSGRVISIQRERDKPEHLIFRALYKEDEQKGLFDDFSDHEKVRARLAIQLELSRAVMGFNAPDVLKDFVLFKKLPITPLLNPDEFTRVLWEVEAALQSVFYIGASQLLEMRSSKGAKALLQK